LRSRSVAFGFEMTLLIAFFVSEIQAWSGLSGMDLHKKFGKDQVVRGPEWNS